MGERIRRYLTGAPPSKSSFTLRFTFPFPFLPLVTDNLRCKICQDCPKMAHQGDEDLVASKTEGFKLGDKKTVEEYAKLGESPNSTIGRLLALLSLNSIFDHHESALPLSLTCFRSERRIFKSVEGLAWHQQLSRSSSRRGRYPSLHHPLTGPRSRRSP